MDVNFAAAQSPGLNGVKVGLAATGQSANDFWNFYSRDDGNGNWLVNGALPNLKYVNGSASLAGLSVSNAPGCWANGSADAMYNTYVYPFNGGNVTVSVTNLPMGQYDFYVYGVDANYQLTVGSVNYGVKTTLDQPVINPTVWQEGRQYVSFRGVSVGAGQGVTLTVLPGVGGYAVISGMQISSATVAAGTPPSIVTQPQSQTAGVGSNVTFTVTANGTAPLGYQWRLGGTNLSGATGSALMLANVQAANAGTYSVLVTNSLGSVLSSNAVLTVNPSSTISFLVDLDFGMGQTQSYKVGFAATGETTNDFWNYYTRDDGNGGYRTFGALSNLALVDGTATAVGMTIANAPGGWYNGSTDPMYDIFLYPFNGGNVTITLTNLPAGQYDFYAYSHDGNYDLMVGATDYGAKTNYDWPLNTPLVWQEGRQYSLFRSVSVGAGQAVTLTALSRARAILPSLPGCRLVRRWWWRGLRRQ